MKKCITCKEEKPIEEFYESKGRRRNDCKTCLLALQKRRWRDRKKKAVDLFGGECTVCGYNKNIAAFDFHHLDPSEKEYNWNTLKCRPWNEVIAELKKCTLLCKNCHSEIHHPEMTLDYTSGEKANASLNFDRIETIKSTGVCPECKTKTYGTKFCSTTCAKKSRRKVVRPSKEVLLEEINSMSWLAIGRKYGVSDNAVRKWAKSYKII